MIPQLKKELTLARRQVKRLNNLLAKRRKQIKHIERSLLWTDIPHNKITDCITYANLTVMHLKYAIDEIKSEPS